MAFQYAAPSDSVCLDVRGADAAAFLHAQLCQGILGVEPIHAPLAGWADARGRARALLRICRFPDRWLLVTPRDGADDLLKKLRMFVLRAKATLELATDVGVAALLGDAGEWLAARGVTADTPAGQLVRRGELGFIRVGPSYWQVLGAPAALASFAAGLTTASAGDVALAEIRLGIPAITSAVADRFVAQMLNLDALGAVSFDKGCYPGQEIIARVHNLGGVKRRARRYAAPSAPPTVGAAVQAGGTAVGEIVRSAAAASGCELLAVVDHAAVGAPLTCDGAALRELELPFDLPTD
ncbi:MAG TPA: folate-binding protein [Gammaproteobacteria bacterium]|nr:folate-binding protein [Gammaproteobacteria bacterium]